MPPIKCQGIELSARFQAYFHTPDMLLPLAKQAGLEIPPEALTTQRLACLAIAHVDTVWDEMPEAQQPLYQYCGQQARGGEGELPVYLKGLAAERLDGLRTLLEPSQYNAFFGRGIQIFDLFKKYTAAKDLLQYSDARQQEGRLAADMMTGVLPKAIQQQHGYATYASRCAQVLGASTLLNSFENFGSDYKKGLLPIAPTLSNRVRMGRLATQALVACREPLGTPMFLRLWGRGAKVRLGIPVRAV